MRPMTALPPAPGDDLHPALELANTLQTTPAGTADLIANPESATAWLSQRELLTEGISLGRPCATRLLDLRDAVRALLAGVIGQQQPPETALAVVNAALIAVPTADLLAWDTGRGLHRSARHPLDRATAHLLAVIAVDAVDLLTGPDAAKLAACGAPRCSRFLLRTHAARQWCSVRCGDRVRAARAYARRGMSTGARTL
ncbi:hypothetical protein D5S17_06265 [Pseudonocardiaceae bacterium YIM PH 21723]|nr:hypothetical protein D5S17_06265 [Pseudonocardiaceae bacterium YIM PH 21723]